MVHHSNDLPWRAVAKTIHVHLTQGGRLDADDFDSQLAYYGDRIALVAISNASNVKKTAGRWVDGETRSNKATQI